MSTTKIEWTGRVWNPVIGCSAVSAGCANCYAIRMAHRHAFNPLLKDTYSGLTVKHPNGKVGWTGRVRCLPDRLKQPLLWKKPEMVFVNSMSDLFHEDVPFEFVAKCWDTMFNADHHTFQILTKRPERMLAFAQWMKGNHRAIDYDNVWLGVSVEDQKAADERIPLLLQVPAAVRWVSCEPLIGPVNLRYDFLPRMESLGNTLDWIVCGGESGPNARPTHPDWARTLRDQCKEAEVPFFFKQWGEWVMSDEVPSQLAERNDATLSNAKYRSGMFTRVGKKNAGRTLDGVIHNEYPVTP